MGERADPCCYPPGRSASLAASQPHREGHSRELEAESSVGAWDNFPCLWVGGNVLSIEIGQR